MCSQIVHGDGAWKRWFPTVAVNESLGGLNDFVEGLPGLKFIFHGFEGATGYDALHPANTSSWILPPLNHAMRRYDALSHKLPPRHRVALDHAQNRAPYATGAIAGEDGVIW